MAKWHCTRCDRESESEAERSAWRCPFCDCPHRSRNDKAIVNALCQQWQRLAASEANKAYSRRGRSIVAARVGTLDDLVQVAHLAMLDAARKHDGSRGSFSTFATPSIRWALNRALSGELRGMGSLPTNDGGQVLDVADPHSIEPIDDAAKIEIRAKVREAIARLHPRHREIMASKLEGKSLEAIAKTAGVSYQRTQQLSAKAITKLADSLAGFA